MPPEQPQIAGLRDRVLWNRWSIVGIRQTLGRSEEHTSELQSQSNIVCRLLLEKKATNMLWFTGSGLLIAWFILKFALHKAGAIHIMLFLPLSFYFFPVAQVPRTKRHKESLPQS